VKGRALLPMDCYSCHASDDAHNGNFGRQCERCHITSEWGAVKSRLDSALPWAHAVLLDESTMPYLWSHGPAL